MAGAAPVAELFQSPREIEELGDLYANIWQACYVTADLGRGMELLGEQLGVTNFTEVPTASAEFFKGEDEPAEWETRVAMGGRPGGPIIELIEPIAGEVEFYRRFLPDDSSTGLRFHHLAVLLPLGDESWESTKKLVESHGLPHEYTILIPDRARLAYIDTTALLGHYLELCQLQPADTEFFSTLRGGSD
jgi:hypothetical protein